VAVADSAVRAALAAERTIDPASFPARTVGVAPFRVSSPDPSLNVLGYGLADLLITDLSRSRELQVVDRLRVDAFVRETGLVEAGYVDSATAPRMGRILGARRVVSGALVATTATAIRLDGRVGDVVTGTIGAVRGTAGSIDAVLDAEKSLAFAIFDRLGVTLTPAERAAVEQRPTRDLGALLAYSRGVRAEAQRDLPTARAWYREALRRDPGFSGIGDRLALLRELTRSAPMIERAGGLAIEGINRRMPPGVVGATDPAFRQLVNATIIIILDLP
jgi:TolB-like protein